MAHHRFHAMRPRVLLETAQVRIESLLDKKRKQQELALSRREEFEPIRHALQPGALANLCVGDPLFLGVGESGERNADVVAILQVLEEPQICDGDHSRDRLSPSAQDHPLAAAGAIESGIIY